MGTQSLDITSTMKVLFAVSLVLLPLLAQGIEVEEDRQEDISERYQCYVPGQCQEYSVDFKKTEDVDHCQKFCGTDDDCNWWSFEPAQNLCVLFGNCTESGNPNQVVCPDCISGQKLCPARECHGAFKCEGHFIDSFNIAHLEDCIEACRDDESCMWYTLEKTHDHCVLYEDCDVQNDCATCASGTRDCSVGYHGPTQAPTQAPTQSQCRDEGCNCVYDTDCNSGYCNHNNECAPKCLSRGNPCYADNDCCSYFCDLEFGECSV